MRATIAAHYPRPDHRLTDPLAAGIDQQAAARAQNAVAVLGRELDNLLAQDRDPATRLRPTAEQIKEARSRSDAMRPTAQRHRQQGQTRHKGGTESPARGDGPARRALAGRRCGPPDPPPSPASPNVSQAPSRPPPPQHQGRARPGTSPGARPVPPP